ncbi:hypothetical protein BS78_03G121700 [Paspalum vaginatum]|nr:hypothetical protein BS78_03G121700 [Paspalum vaginatum]
MFPFMSNARVPFDSTMSQAEIGFVPNRQLHSTVNANDQVLEISAPKPRKGGRGKKVSQRGKAFSKEEDRIICSAFLNVSKDPITGTNQSSGGYYQRMHAYFEEHIGGPSSRTATTIQHRWLSIQKAVNKFSGFFSTVERLNESGKNEQTRIDAVKMYEENEAWTFEHCWNVLHHEPKWNDKMLEINTVGTATKVNQRIAVNSVGEPVDGGNEDNTAQGRDTAKKRKYQNVVTSESSAAIEVLSAMNARGQLKDDKEDTQMSQILQRKDAKIELQQNLIALQREEMEKRWELEKEKLELNREEV